MADIKAKTTILPAVGTDVFIPFGTPEKVAKDYVAALRATAELQGDNFTPDSLPFAAWLTSQP